MDKGRARFVLGSFRPNGADASVEDFAEALGLAAKDRELGEWLVNERAFDAIFAESLAKLILPDGLRDTVLLAMLEDGEGMPHVSGTADESMAKGVSAIEIPSGLRERVLVAMERSKETPAAIFNWARFALPTAAAAGIMLALYFSRPDSSTVETPMLVADPTLSAEGVQAGFVRVFESPIFSLDDTTENDPRTLVAHLRSKGLPCGGSGWPPGLKDRNGRGCRELTINGKKGSLICFDVDDAGTVHLVIFRKTDFGDALPAMAQPDLRQDGDWARASWEHEKYAFTLIGRTDSEHLAALF